MRCARPIVSPALALALGICCSAETQAQIVALQPDTPVEDEMTSRELRLYRVSQNVGDSLRIVVIQRGIDVVVTLFDPAGDQLAEVDSPTAAMGPEILAVLAPTSGDYQIELRPYPDPWLYGGWYEIEVMTAERYAAFLTEEMAGDGTRLVTRYPAIDMHLHTMPWGSGPAPDTARFIEAWRYTEAVMDTFNVVYALVSGSNEIAQQWRRLAPDRLMAGLLFPCDGGMAPNLGPPCLASRDSFPRVAWIRDEVRAGRLHALGEITAQYYGLAPTDPKLEPYWTLAEELDLPVTIHMGLVAMPDAAFEGLCGPPPCSVNPRFRVGVGDPGLLEELLARHPKLRLDVMHAGWPFHDDLKALMLKYPQISVDIAGLPAFMPREAFHDLLTGFVDLGFGDRIMWGSDGSFGASIEAIMSAPTLTEQRKRAILCGNAARYLRLPASTCQ